jgi:cytochrome c oxidase subunit 2
MKVDVYEKAFMWGIGVLLAAFFTTTAIAAFGGAMHPPSHVETIDPTKVFTDARFRPAGVSVDPQGGVHARIVGMTFAWMPNEMTLPAETQITFHVTAIDVVHGFEIVRTNGQSMAIPGYISQFTTRFDAGEYLIVCNEYCGVGHHQMAAKMHVVPKDTWKAPAAIASTTSPTVALNAGAGGSHGRH